jgi:hypothetical protein
MSVKRHPQLAVVLVAEQHDAVGGGPADETPYPAVDRLDSGGATGVDRWVAEPDGRAVEGQRRLWVLDTPGWRSTGVHRCSGASAAQPDGTGRRLFGAAGCRNHGSGPADRSATRPRRLAPGEGASAASAVRGDGIGVAGAEKADLGAGHAVAPRHRPLAADPRAWRRVPASRPGPELVGFEYCPDVRDLVVCDVERVHRHGDAVQLGHQAGLTVDRTLQDPHAGYRTGPDRRKSARSARRLRPGAGRR